MKIDDKNLLCIIELVDGGFDCDYCLGGDPTTLKEIVTELRAARKVVELAAIVGADALANPELNLALWAYEKATK